jgi:hypothetical protein
MIVTSTSSKSRKQRLEVLKDMQKKEKKRKGLMIQIIPNQETEMIQKAQKRDATTTTMMMKNIAMVATAALVEVEFSMHGSRGGLHQALCRREARGRIVQAVEQMHQQQRKNGSTWILRCNVESRQDMLQSTNDMQLKTLNFEVGCQDLAVMSNP